MPKKNQYEQKLIALQIELVKLQNHVISNGKQILVIIEGRDASGKDGTIKAITQHLSPRDTRVVALGKPSERDLGNWYFQRYVAHLPSKGEFILFNRSWYNRAGVEVVMKFCTKKQYNQFIKDVSIFETMLTQSGITILKYYLDISKTEQANRLIDRSTNPLKQWKISPIDLVAQKKWVEYSLARDNMLKYTNHPDAPWTLICADNKKLTHINLISHLLTKLDYPKKNHKILTYDPKIILDL